MHSVIILLLLLSVMTDAVQVTKVCKGESKLLMCSTQSITDYTNTYVRFENKKVKDKAGKYQYLKNGTLLVENINASDQGLYEYRCEYRKQCSITRITSCKIEVKVNCENLSVSMCSTIKMTCKTTIHKATITKIKWYNPKRLPLTNNNRTTDKSKEVFSGRLKVAGDTLEITDARKADEGTYYCIALKEDGLHLKQSSYLYHVHVVFKEASNSSNTTISRTTQPALPTAMATRASNEKTDVESSNSSKPTNTPTTQPDVYEKSSRKVSLIDETAPTTTAVNNSTSNNTSDKPAIRARKSSTTRVPGTDSKLCMYIISLIGLAWLMTSSIIGF